ncbi:AMP-binding protein [Granulicella sp. L46]|uniref:AMP-binding protein n=1 Tax=Granulicella sp. L46 TaxID=1641865 RepID=UPI00131E47FB|nr:AMP-binding protein [Granulicella sp. L46]
MRPHLASLVDDFRRNGPQIAIVRYRGVRRYTMTYGDLAALAGRFAADLERRGITPGDRVVLWGENSAEWVAAFFGCLLRGVLAVPLDAAGSPDFAARVIADVSPKLILADTPRLSALPANVPQLLLDDLAHSLPTEPLFTVNPAVTLDAPFQIIFTSGTTAAPKGIVHTNRNVLASLDPIEREMQKYLRYERLVHPLRFLHSLPLSHVFGQFMGLWTPALLAAEVHFETNLEPARMLDRIRLERISVLIAVPRSLELLRSHLQLLFPELGAQLAASEGWPIYKRFVRFRHVHRLTGWKFWALISGGATLPPDLELFWGRLGYAVIQGYGMTETAALVTLNHPFHVGRGTLGKPLPGREVRISPEGEIMVRGDVVSGSTWADGAIQPRATEWLATGDLATQDDSGELRFSGRRGDVIVTAAGLNIYPVDLEAALLKQPGVRAAAVVASEGANGPEPVAVFIADADESQLRQILAQANGSLADFQQIRRVLRWPEPSFPFTSTGKLLRRVVADWAADQLAATAAHPSAGRGDVLVQMIATVTGEAPANVTDSTRLAEDLHLDSLGRVQLQSFLEQRFGLELADEQIAQVKTLAELRALTGASAPSRASSPTEGHGPQAAPTEAHPVTAARFAPAVPAAGATDPAHRYPRWPWLTPINALRVTVQELAIRPLVWLLAAPRVERRLSSRTRPPLLIIANHVTAYDVPLILYGLPSDLRHRVAIAMSGEMLLDFRRGRGASSPVLNPLLPIAYWLITVFMNVFPLPRLGGFRRSFEHAGRALDRGYSVIIFPEGHRSADGTLQPFRSGIGLLAQQANADVLPVALVGLDQIVQANKRWFHSGRITVRVGEPIPYDPHSTPDQTTQRLQAAMAKLLA